MKIIKTIDATWFPKIGKNHSNKTTNHAITKAEEIKEEQYIGQPLEHERYIGEYSHTHDGYAEKYKNIKLGCIGPKLILNTLYGVQVGERNG